MNAEAQSSADASAAPQGARVVRGQAALLASSVGQLAISVLTVAVVGRWLSTPGFALFGLIGAIFSIARDLLDLGSTGVATRLLAAAPSRSREILGVVMVWRGVLAVAAMLLIALAAAMLGPPEERTIVMAAGVALVASVSGAFNALFNARHRQTAPAFASIVVQGGALAALVLLKRAGASEASAAWVLVGREVLWWIVIGVLGLRLLGAAPAVPRDAAHMRPVVLPGLVFGSAVLLHQVLVQGDLPLARWGLSEAAAAVVAASSRPIGAMVALPWIAAAPLIAAVTALRPRDPALTGRLVASACGLGLSCGLLVAVLGAASGREILDVLYGVKYAGDPAAVQVCRGYCAVLGAAIAAAAPTMALVGLHRERALLLVCVVCVVVASAVKLIGLRRGDVGMIALTTAAAEWVIAGGVLSLAARASGAAILGRGVLLTLLYAGAVCGVLRTIELGSPWRLALAMGIGVVGLVLVSRTREAAEYRRMCRIAGMPEGAAP